MTKRQAQWLSLWYVVVLKRSKKKLICKGGEVVIKGIEIKVLEKPKALKKPKELGKPKEPGYKQTFIFYWRVNLKRKINQWKDSNKKNKQSKK